MYRFSTFVMHSKLNKKCYMAHSIRLQLSHTRLEVRKITHTWFKTENCKNFRECADDLNIF